VPDNLVKQAKGNKTKPFPWGGDYTDAKSVSVTMGEKNVEKGLHTNSVRLTCCCAAADDRSA